MPLVAVTQQLAQPILAEQLAAEMTRAANSSPAVVAFALTVPLVGAALTYWYWIGSADICSYDYGHVRFGSTTLKTYNLCTSTNTGNWAYGSLNVLAYRGQVVDLRFVVTTDGSLNSNFFLDDVSFSATGSSPPPLAGPPPPVAGAAAARKSR